MAYSISRVEEDTSENNTILFTKHIVIYIETQLYFS